jgi:predicted CXXCH cytochrome family protein
VECHRPVIRQFAVMHEPVVSENCLTCHAAHESNEKALLRESAPNVCLQCHEQSLLSERPKQHHDGRSNCLGCHSGHGGDGPHLLRAAISTLHEPSQAGEVGLH